MISVDDINNMTLDELIDYRKSLHQLYKIAANHSNFHDFLTGEFSSIIVEDELLEKQKFITELLRNKYKIYY